MQKIEEVLYGRKNYRLQDQHRPYLKAIERAARELAARRASLSAAVLAAHEADVPFRAIAGAADVSHEQARRIVKAARNR